MKTVPVTVLLTEDQKEDLRDISAREMGAPNISGAVRFLIEQYKKKADSETTG